MSGPVRFDAVPAGTGAVHGASEPLPRRSALRLRLHLALIGLDAACVVCAFFLALMMFPEPGQLHWFSTASAVLPVYLGAAFLGGAYSVQVLQDHALGVKRALHAFCLATAAVIFVAFYFKASNQFSRVTFAAGFVDGVLLLAIARSGFLRRVDRLLGGNPYSVVLIAEAGCARPTGSFSRVLDGASFGAGEDHPEMYDRLARGVAHADRIVVACSPANRLKWVGMLQGLNVRAEIATPELDVMGTLSLARCGDTPTLVVARGPLGFSNRVIKRALDIAVAATALLVCLPLMLVVAIAVALDSPGGVFFVQTRIGHGNRQFRMLKFRTMRVEARDARGDRLTTRDDDRVSRVGRLLRRTSIDELPQLLNVLIGDMSIVGPRPHAVGARAADKLYWEVDSRYWHRHAAKPGLTGLAQVRGYRGSTEAEQDLTNRLHADLEYLNDWSIWRDLHIILLTFGVLTHRNAF
ncbi:exopolysaccharide biosynthesis polyprenyl glycosylphosphotransferase [Sphingomonas arantia]|uniref:Exopolysaccharide biosynthesis polyprenyl glycosylphosphotransferase n=1 Tax=Sphingomonas arantia TaxID=1460676 RepID=A0ABW4TSE7_9SPHN